jgi:hypothetical protein
MCQVVVQWEDAAAAERIYLAPTPGGKILNLPSLLFIFLPTNNNGAPPQAGRTTLLNFGWPEDLAWQKDLPEDRFSRE